MKITSQFLREKYLKFFSDRGHAVIPSASLFRKTTLPYCSQRRHASPHSLSFGTKASQGKPSLRRAEVRAYRRHRRSGRRQHLTFFEMLGNWSLGDYFNHQSIKWSYEFLTGKDYLGLDVNRISVTVFAGDDDAPRDEDSARVWRSAVFPRREFSTFPRKTTGGLPVLRDRADRTRKFFGIQANPSAANIATLPAIAESIWNMEQRFHAVQPSG